MKIEKVNDHQIRCTLTKADLQNRELKISELAYGTEKAKELFKDMMQQAHFEFGFEAEDIPLMIEAIPMSSDCIVLIITKVDDPDELDTRFSRFSPSDEDDSDEISDMNSEESSEEIHATRDAVLDEMLRRAMELKDQILKGSEDSNTAYADAPDEPKAPVPVPAPKQDTSNTSEPDVSALPLVRLVSFDSIDDLVLFARTIQGSYNGVNTLYKGEQPGTYLLLMNAESDEPQEFNRIINLSSEFGHVQRYAAGIEAYLKEHLTPMLIGHALSDILNLN